MSDYYKGKYRIESTRFKGWDYADFGWHRPVFCVNVFKSHVLHLSKYHFLMESCN